MQYLISIDIGTTSLKSLAFDLQGEILLRNSVDYPIYNPHPGYSEQDPEQIFEAFYSCLKDTTSAFPADELIAVSFSSAMHGILALDRSGKPLSPIITWADNRASKQASQLKGSPQGELIYQSTGTPIHPMSPLCKIAWLKIHQPQLFAQTTHFVGIKEYIFYRLFGKFIIDHSLASATGLFNIHQKIWDPAALAWAGITPDLLSDPVGVTHSEAGLDNKLAGGLGIKPGTPFYIGASDGCLANLGEGVLDKSVAAVTIGTSGAIRITTDHPQIDTLGRTFCYILDQEHFVLGGAVNNGGNVYQWFKDIWGEETSIENSLEIVPPGSEGLVCLPFLHGERAPAWDPQARGAWMGLSHIHGKPHFLRSLLEGVLFGIHHVGLVIEEISGPFQSIRAGGGFFNSHKLAQMLADVSAKDVYISDSIESSSRGAAVLALKELGAINNLSEFLPSNRGKKLTPDPKVQASYQPVFKRYLDLFNDLYN